MRIEVTLAVCGFSLLACACGGGDGNLPQLKTDLEGNKRIDQLSVTEGDELCADLLVYGKDFVETFGPRLCRLAGTFTTSQSECEKATNDCIERSEAVPPSDGACRPGRACAATVSEVQACINDSVVQLDTRIDSVPTCQQRAQGAATSPTTSSPDQPESCKRLFEICPVMFEGVANVPSLPGDASAP